MVSNSEEHRFVNDLAFRHIFTTRANRDLLLDFVTSLLGIPASSVKHFRLLNGDIPAKRKADRSVRLDLLMELDEMLVNIELQHGHKSGFLERSAGYAIRALDNNRARRKRAKRRGKKAQRCNKKKKDKKHKVVSHREKVYKKIICLNIVDFSPFPADEQNEKGKKSQKWVPHSPVQLSESQRKDAFAEGSDEDFHRILLLTDVITGKIASFTYQWHFFELRNVGKLTGEEKAVPRSVLWLNFLKVCSDEEVKTLNKFQDPIINKAIRELRKTKSRKELESYLWTYDKAESRYEDDLFYERQEGKAEGKADTLIWLLCKRFPECPQVLLDKVRKSTDMNWLESMLDVVFDSPSLKELAAQLDR